MLHILRGGLWHVTNARAELARVAPSPLALVLPFTILGGTALPAFLDAGALMVRVRWSSPVNSRVRSRQGSAATPSGSPGAGASITQAGRAPWALALPFTVLGSDVSVATSSGAGTGSAPGLLALVLPYSVLGGGVMVVPALPADARIEAMVQSSAPYVATVRSRSYNTF
jgi:hypothetical protein